MAQVKQGKWPKVFPVRENTGNLKILLKHRENTGNLEILLKHREFGLLKFYIPSSLKVKDISIFATKNSHFIFEAG